MEANWSAVNDDATVNAIKAAARIVAGRYRDRSVNMLAEYDDLVQEGLILVATKPRLQFLDPTLLRFLLVRDLNAKVRYRESKANVTVYLSSLESE